MCPFLKNNQDNYNIQETPKIDEGIFLTKDVSDILNLPYYKVRYEINNYWLSSSFGNKGNRAINFFALIEFYTFYRLRDQGISANEIKKFHSNLERDLDTKYPFASIRISTHDKSTLKDNQKNKIWYEYNGFLMKGAGRKQPSFKKFIEPFLKRIEFDNEKIAKRYFPLNKSKYVVVDPSHQFGQPTIEGTNIQIAAINNLKKAGETKEIIGELYGLSIKQISDAIKYYQIRA